jgi:hypothetical protein
MNPKLFPWPWGYKYIFKWRNITCDKKYNTCEQKYANLEINVTKIMKILSENTYINHIITFSQNTGN